MIREDTVRRRAALQAHRGSPQGSVCTDVIETSQAITDVGRDLCVRDGASGSRGRCTSRPSLDDHRSVNSRGRQRPQRPGTTRSSISAGRSPIITSDATWPPHVAVLGSAGRARTTDIEEVELELMRDLLRIPGRTHQRSARRGLFRPFHYQGAGPEAGARPGRRTRPEAVPARTSAVTYPRRASQSWGAR